jgi:hypothetical protein
LVITAKAQSPLAFSLGTAGLRAWNDFIRGRQSFSQTDKTDFL